MSSRLSSFQPLMQVTSLISSSVAIPFSMRNSIFCSRVMASLLLLEKIGEGFGFDEFVPESAHGTCVAPVGSFVRLECHQPCFDSLDDFESFSLATLGDLDYFGVFHDVFLFVDCPVFLYIMKIENWVHYVSPCFDYIFTACLLRYADAEKPELLDPGFILLCRRFTAFAHYTS